VTSYDEAARRAFGDAVAALLRGDFSISEPLFTAGPGPRDRPAILDWLERGWFDAEPEALAEALACACFLGRDDVATVLLARDVDPAAGNATGLNAFHWAANRGQLATVRLLIAHGAPLEKRNHYGGTVLATAVWSAVHEPREHHLAVVEALLAAGADVHAAPFPCGDARVDEALRRFGAP
jgi:hypothetical protein